MRSASKKQGAGELNHTVAEERIYPTPPDDTELSKKGTKLTAIFSAQTQHELAQIPAKVLQVIDFLIQNPQITEVSFANCHLIDTDVMNIAGFLKTNPSLKILSLDGNDFGNEGLAFIGLALNKNTTLTEISGLDRMAGLDPELVHSIQAKLDRNKEASLLRDSQQESWQDRVQQPPSPDRGPDMYAGKK